MRSEPPPPDGRRVNPIILASASPRRRDLLSLLGIPFDVITSNVHDDSPGPDFVLWPPIRNPSRLARRLAAAKAHDVAQSWPQATVIGGDTVVVKGVIQRKPLDPLEAKGMLMGLRAHTHRVMTAIAVLSPQRRMPFVSHTVTVVQMRNYSEGEIDAYIARGDPFDKAGGYAIQDELFHPVESYDGCYCNVVGLPLWSTIELLRKSSIDITPHLDRLLPQCSTCPLRPDTR